MRSLLVLSIALCLGLATAVPVTDLLRALLKRQEETELATVAPPADVMPDFVPSHEEFVALHAIGVAIVHLTELAKEDPKSVIDFVISVGESIPEEKRRALFKRQTGGRPGQGGQRGQGAMMGPGSQGPPPPDMGAEIMKEVFENGMYETVIKYVNILGRVMEHSGAIFQWTIMGPDCTDCPPLPEDLVPILMELAGEGPNGGSNGGPHGGPSGAHGGPSGAHGGPSGAQGGPSGTQGGPSGAQGGSQGGKGGPRPVDSPEEDDSSVEIEQERALLKRLVALLADKK